MRSATTSAALRRSGCAVYARVRVSGTALHYSSGYHGQQRTSPSSPPPATHRYLSVSQVIAAQATLHTAAQPPSPSLPAALPRRCSWPRVAGLSLTLPPLCTWGAASLVDEPTGPRHGAPQPHGTRYAAIWRPIESYLAQLQPLPDTQHGGDSSTYPNGASAPLPPLCLSLRLFPDLTVAQLPAVSRSRDAPSHGLRPALAPHAYPLDAILGARDSLWGDGVDTQQVFRDAIAGLRETGCRLLPQLPLVLQLPTRLLVSQQFLHDLATLLVREGWRSIAFELPSTHQLYSSSAHEDGGSAADSAAVDGGWCRLPLLCTPWPTLCRHPVLGASLRQLRRHDVVPFHMLLSWAATEARLFSGLEKSLVVDVTAPMPGAALRQAQVQSPARVGCAGESLQADLANAADDEARAPVAQRIYLSENPATSRSVGVGLSAGVVDAVRRHQSSAARRGGAGGTGADLAEVEGAMSRQRTARASATPLAPAPCPATPHNDNCSGLPLVLDAPPEHLRALLARSVVDTSSAHATPVLTSRQRLLQKVGKFMQHTVHAPTPPAGAGEAGTAVPPTQTVDSSRGSDEAALQREAEELEELLRAASSASDAAASMTEAERWMAEAQQHLLAGASGSTSQPPMPTSPEAGASAVAAARGGAGIVALPSAWDACAGYWACLHALVRDIADAPVVWTTPTFHAAAVAAWSAAFHAFARGAVDARADPGQSPAAVASPPTPAVVPVWHPALSAMRLEVERRSREGQCFPQPPRPGSVSEGPALHTWLPAPLSAALAEALATLPAEYQAGERQRLLRDLRRLRRNGAQAARRRASVVEGASGSVGDGDAESAEVRIRVSHVALPMQLLPPLQARQRESEALQAAAAAARHRAGGAGAADVRQFVRVADGSVAEAVEQGYRDLHALPTAAEAERTDCSSQLAPVALLHLPSPGLTPEALRRSWRCLS